MSTKTSLFPLPLPQLEGSALCATSMEQRPLFSVFQSSYALLLLNLKILSWQSLQSSSLYTFFPVVC